MKDNLKKGREFLSETTDLPPEIILDIPKITIVGNKEITVENHKGILVFEKDKVKINTKNGPIKIQGTSFEIMYIGIHTLTISGDFRSIEYEGQIHE